MLKYARLIFKEDALAGKPKDAVEQLKSDMIKDLAQQVRSFKQAHKGKCALLGEKCKVLVDFMNAAGAWDNDNYKLCNSK